MVKSVDIREHALALLRMSKKFLVEDNDLDANAFILADEQYVRPIELQDEQSKIESCQKIVEEARKLHALGIITVFLARFRDFTNEQFSVEEYSWGDIAKAGGQRCILVTVSGPGIKNWAIAVPFLVRNRKVTFQKATEFDEGVDVGLFPGWSDYVTPPRVS